jgi:hypothetical protein
MTNTNPESLGSTPSSTEKEPISFEVDQSTKENATQRQEFQEDQRLLEAEDTIFEALEEIQLRQPDLDFGELYEQMFTEKTKLPKYAIQQLAKNIWGLTTLSEDPNAPIFSKKGAEKLKKLMSEGKTGEIIKIINDNFYKLAELENSLDAPEEAIAVGMQAMKDLEEIKFQRTLTGIHTNHLTYKYTVNNNQEKAWVLKVDHDNTGAQREPTYKELDLEKWEEAQEAEKQKELETALAANPYESLEALQADVDEKLDQLENPTGYIGEGLLSLVQHNEKTFSVLNEEERNYFDNAYQELIDTLSPDLALELADFYTDTYLPKLADQDPDTINLMRFSQAKIQNQ